jgi:hypothetical protein
MVICSLKVSNVAVRWSADVAKAALAALVGLGLPALPAAMLRSIAPKHNLAALTHLSGPSTAQAVLVSVRQQRHRVWSGLRRSASGTKANGTNNIQNAKRIMHRARMWPIVKN